jgi:hypothetical protein
MSESSQPLEKHTEDAVMEVDSTYDDEEEEEEEGKDDDDEAEGEDEAAGSEDDYCSSSGRESSAPLRHPRIHLSERGQPQLEVDPSSTDDDCDTWSTSESGSHLDSETTSIGSAAFEYEYENGRRYHGFCAGQYALPNDEAEQDRLDMMHHIYSLMLGGKLHLAPLKNPQNILDVGTGTGIWAIDMAE